MSRLNSLTDRLKIQFLDQHGLILPEELITEAFYSSLAELNLFLSTNYSLTGLDPAEKGEMPADYEPILLKGAAAVVIEGLSLHKFASLSNLPANNLDLENWARFLRQERNQMLDKLRLKTFAQSDAMPWAHWKLDDPVRYE
jgi:hypothetical protein